MKKEIEWNEFECDALFETRDQWRAYLRAVRQAVAAHFGARVIVHIHENTSGGCSNEFFYGFDIADNERLIRELDDIRGTVWEQHQEMMGQGGGRDI